MFRPFNPIDSLSRGTRHFVGIDETNGSYESVSNMSLANRIKRQVAGSPNVLREGFDSKQVFSGGGPISYRGPGLNNFLVNEKFGVINRRFADTTNYRESATLEKVYPICGTKGYFSLRVLKAPALYLIAESAEKNGVKFGDVSTSVDIQDAACWRFDTTDAPEPNSGMLINKRFPGMALTVVDDNTIRLLMPGGEDKTRYYLTEERALSTYDGMPMPRPPKFSDFEIRNGWDLADMGRNYGPLEFRSYELEPTSTRTAEACAAAAAKQPMANGFVFIGGGSDDGKNCRIKAGGYWPALTGTTEALSKLVSGKLKGEAAGMYRDPTESFEIRRGWNVDDANINYGANQSYELEPIRTPTAEACAAAALQNPRANSFVFVPGAAKNCRIKAGGFWPEMDTPDASWSSLIGGILKGKSMNDNFEVRKGYNLADANRSYGDTPSYELKPVRAYSAENCAEIAMNEPKANGFVYMPSRYGADNCKLKVGGFWPAGQDPNWSKLTAGIKK